MSGRVSRWRGGPRVLLVHGSVTAGEKTRAEQRPLSGHWGLQVVDRRDDWPGEPGDGEDLDGPPGWHHGRFDVAVDGVEPLAGHDG